MEKLIYYFFTQFYKIHDKSDVSRLDVRLSITLENMFAALYHYRYYLYSSAY